MQIENLYHSVLINPIGETDANKLYIVSGYASATFARHHILDLLKFKSEIEINLIIGMPGKRSDDMAFKGIHEEFKDKFKAYYFVDSPPVHCKVYSWYRDDRPLVGYAGSANYSQPGFFSDSQLNQISSEDPVLIKGFFDRLLRSSTFVPDSVLVIPEGTKMPLETESVFPGRIRWDIPEKRVTISFLDIHGVLPKISGLNWGQRVEKRINKITKEIAWVKREPNQAYLSLKLDARKEGFLPDRAYSFTLLTDDGHSFDCVVAQDERKAIETNKNNSLLGIYFRNRLGIPLGNLVTVDDLIRYGRTDYTVEKINEETFLLDFSKH